VCLLCTPKSYLLFNYHRIGCVLLILIYTIIVQESSNFSMSCRLTKNPLRKVQSTKSASDNREVRKVPVPSHRLTPLKEHWLKIYTPVVEHLRLDIRFNVKSRNVEIRNPVPDDEVGSQHLQKAADFVKAFVYGFEVEDALALIRLDNLFVESFEVCFYNILFYIYTLLPLVS